MRRQTFARLLAFTLFLTFDLIVFGAFVRLTDSGLGCPDWPGCYGKITPLGASAEIAAEVAKTPDGAVTPFKAWVEMIHRYVAMALGLLCIAIAVLATRWRNELNQTPRLAWFTLFWVCLQGAFGAWTVTLKLMPIIVTLHLMFGLFLMALLSWQHSRFNRLQPAFELIKLKPLAIIFTVLLTVQIFLGGWVSTNYAVLACTDYPLCNGALVPPMDLANGFSFWRKLGLTASGEGLPQAALVGVHWVHRNSYWLVALAGLALSFKLLKHTQVQRFGAAILALLALQMATGLSNIVLGWPLVAAVIHTAGAAALVLVTVRLLALIAKIAPR